MNYLIVGLGNIGVEYANTRHNMGFMVLDAWAQASNILFESGRYGYTATISFKGRKFTLLKPSTYMNLSGKAVRYWMNELKIPVENLLVISDDLNIPFGTIRLRKNGSAGGHNGHEITIHYGDITKKPFYKEYMGLKTDPYLAYYTINSKGKNTLIQEEGWAEEGTQPNHMMIYFISSCGKAFYGGVGNTLWIDNVEVIM